jgi:hypothetical protein
LLNEELPDLDSGPNIIRAIKSKRIRRVWHVAGMREKTIIHPDLVGELEERRPLGRTWRK